MTAILMGQNRFEDCHTLIAWHQRPVLRAGDGPSGLFLDTTELGEDIRGIRVENLEVTHGHGVQVVGSDTMTSVLVDEQAILFLTRIDSEKIHLKLDLRPLGLNIFDDINGLHVGQSVIADNAFISCQIGVRLA